MEIEDFNIEKEALQSNLQKRLKNAEKKVLSLKFALSQCLNWSEIHHEGILLQANLYRGKKMPIA